MDTTKREFMKISATAVSALMLGNLLSGTSAHAATMAPGRAISMEECQSLNYLQMAECSPMVQDAWQYLSKEIGLIQDKKLRTLVADIYTDSTPKLTNIDDKTRTQVWQRLRAEGYTNQSQQNFLPPLLQDMGRRYPSVSAPGSGYGSHHSYPGGLVTHVATNVKITRSIVDAYADIYSYSVDRDIAMAAQLLHDLHKPYVFQWLADSSSRAEQPLAGTGEHHVLSAAELIVRNAPAELVVAQACAHTHPGNPQEEAQVVGWLKAAAIIAGADPVRYGLLDKTGNTLPLPRRQEGFLCHLGDHDFVLSVPAVQWTLPVMREIAATDYKLSEKDLQGRPFNSLRNMVYAQVSAMHMEQLYTEGKEAVRKAMHSVVRPA